LRGNKIKCNAKKNGSELKVHGVLRVYPGSRVDFPLPGVTKKDIVWMTVKSLAIASVGLDIRFTLLLDACPSSWGDELKELLSNHEVEVIEFQGIGNGSTFVEQVKVIEADEMSEVMFFLEDDYIYLPESLHSTVELFRHNSSVDFATTYDHPDYDRLRFHRLKAPSIESEFVKWVPRRTTTCSFAVSRRAFHESKSVLLRYPELGDIGMSEFVKVFETIGS